MKRRQFLTAGPAAIALGVLGSDVAAQSEPPARPTVDSLKCAEPIGGVSFSGSEEELMLANVKANREHYEALRGMVIPVDTEPAFSVQLPTRPLPSKAAARSTPPAPRRSRSLPKRPAPDELPFLPIASLAPLIESRTISSTELTEIYLDRLKRHDPVLQCVITLTEGLARSQASAADREIRAGRYRGPLHGVPWGVKDLFATKGIRTTWGAKPYEHQMLDFDATVVERLRDAGAVLVAKLTSGELAIGDVWFGGKTRNPWNPELGSSGSSAGPASATSAGLVGFAIGTETNGSIISPASRCGIVGLRPTYGRVSRHGVMTLRWTLDKVGPLCRGVEDCALVFDAIRGPDGHDQTVVDLPFTWNRSRPLGRFHIGFVEQEFDEPAADSTEEERQRWPRRRAALSQTLDVFRRAGAVLEPISLPDLPARSIYAILGAEAGAAFDDLIRSGRVADLSGKGPNDRANQLRTSRFIPAVEYIQAQRARTILFREMERLLARCDAFLAPSDSTSVTMTNLTGHPAVTLNAGFVDGLPEAIMITGRLFDEGTLLRLAEAYEQSTDWHTRRPAVS